MRMHAPFDWFSHAISARYLVRNVTVAYARWWHTVAGATCDAEHMFGLVLVPKRKTVPLEQSEDPPLFREPLS